MQHKSCRYLHLSRQTKQFHWFNHNYNDILLQCSLHYTHYSLKSLYIPLTNGSGAFWLSSQDQLSLSSAESFSCIINDATLTVYLQRQWLWPGRDQGYYTLSFLKATLWCAGLRLSFHLYFFKWCLIKCKLVAKFDKQLFLTYFKLWCN